MKHWEFGRAVNASGLPADARLILHALAVVADWPSSDSDRTRVPGLIPPKYAPSLTNLEEMTGLGRSSVAKYLNVAEGAGWVDRRRPTKAAAQKNKERTSYLLRIPSSAPHGLETEGASAPHGLASAPHGLGLVRETDQASAPRGHKPSTSSTNQHAASTAAAAVELIIEKTGATPAEAELVAQLIAEEKKPRSIKLYKTIANAGELPSWLDRVREATAEVLQRQSVAEAAAAKLGGPHPWPSPTASECDRCTMPIQHPVHRLAALVAA